MLKKWTLSDSWVLGSEAPIFDDTVPMELYVQPSSTAWGSSRQLPPSNPPPMDQLLNDLNLNTSLEKKKET